MQFTWASSYSPPIESVRWLLKINFERYLWLDIHSCAIGQSSWILITQLSSLGSILRFLIELKKEEYLLCLSSLRFVSKSRNHKKSIFSEAISRVERNEKPTGKRSTAVGAQGMPELLHSLIEKNYSRRKWRKYQLSNDLNLIPGMNSMLVLFRLICCINLIHLREHLHVQMRSPLSLRLIQNLIIVSVFVSFFVIQFIKVAKCHNKKSEKIMCNKGEERAQRLINISLVFVWHFSWVLHDLNMMHNVKCNVLIDSFSWEKRIDRKTTKANAIRAQQRARRMAIY